MKITQFVKWVQDTSCGPSTRNPRQFYILLDHSLSTPDPDLDPDPDPNVDYDEETNLGVRTEHAFDYPDYFHDSDPGSDPDPNPVPIQSFNLHPYPA